MSGLLCDEEHSGCAAEPQAVRYADLGGIEGVLNDILELVQWPLMHPEVRSPSSGQHYSLSLHRACTPAHILGRVRSYSGPLPCLPVAQCKVYCGFSSISLTSAHLCCRSTHGWGWSRHVGCCCMAPRVAARLPWPMRSPMSARCRSSGSRPQRSSLGCQAHPFPPCTCSTKFT